MSSSTFLRSAICLGAAFAAAASFAAPAMALDAGKCYSAEQVDAETINAEGDAKQYNLIIGDRTIPTRPKNYFTSTLDGSFGYNIEKSTDGLTKCIRVKYTDIRVNVSSERPPEVRLPKGSENERFMAVQERDYGTRIIMSAKTIVHMNGENYYGPQLVVTKSDKLVQGYNGGIAFTNNEQGSGSSIVTLMNISTNPGLAKFAETTKPK